MRSTPAANIVWVPESASGLETLSYFISHHARAPLTNIIALTRILQDPNLQPEELKEIIRVLSLSAAQLDHVMAAFNLFVQSGQAAGGEGYVYFSDALDIACACLHLPLTRLNVRVNGDFAAVSGMTVNKYLLANLFESVIGYAIHTDPVRGMELRIESRKRGRKLYLFFRRSLPQNISKVPIGSKDGRKERSLQKVQEIVSALGGSMKSGGREDRALICILAFPDKAIL